MIQVNLLPDIKAEFLKAQRTKRLVTVFAFIVSVVFLAILIMMFLFVNVAQKKHGNDLTNDISALEKDYSGIQDLDKIITVQKQLSSLSNLHLQKPLISRVITYLGVITPEKVGFSSFNVDFETSVIIVSGVTDSVPGVNKFVDTVKNAFYIVEGDDRNNIPAFSNVILDSINSNTDNTHFDLSFEFDSEIFNNHDKVTLNIPEINSTLSNIESPSFSQTLNRSNNLFNDGGAQ